ncbi:trafficking protein particle complex subunit 12-like [Glandiceps talaboti]
MDQEEISPNVSVNIENNSSQVEAGGVTETIDVADESGVIIDIGEDDQTHTLGVAIGDLSAATGQLNLGEFAGSEVDLSESPEQQDKSDVCVDNSSRSDILSGGLETEVSLEEDTTTPETHDVAGDDDYGGQDLQNVNEELMMFSPEPSDTSPSTELLTDLPEDVDGACSSKDNKVGALGDLGMSTSEEYSGPLEQSSAQSVPINIQSETNIDDGFESQLVGSPGSSLLDQMKNSDKTEEGGVRKFFASADNAGTGDIAGKSFFDSFTTGGIDSLADSTTSVTSQHSGSVTSQHIPPPTTPPINDVFTSHPSLPTTPPINEVFTSQPPLPSPQLAASQPAFMSQSSQDGEDPFAAAIKMSDIDRRYDAWIPSDTTRQILVAKVTSTGTFSLDVSQLTMPGVVVEDLQGDPIKELVYKFMGEQESNKRNVLTHDNVSQNEEGLQQLIAGGCYRSAIDLTARLLDRFNQGVGAVGRHTLNTPLTLQIWFTRIALMMKLRLFGTAEKEMEAFGNLDRPDIFYEFYPDMYPGKRGSMVPFSFRVLHAELPQYNGKPQDTIDRLYYLHAITSKIISNLETGFAEDGSGIEISDDNRKVSIKLWKSRLTRILYSIGNCLMLMKDYNQASLVFKNVAESEIDNAVNLWSGIGRLHLQLGDLLSADECFKKVESLAKTDKEKSQAFMNK